MKDLNSLPKEEQDQLTTDMYLMNFQESLSELKRRGVSIEIIGDTMINVLNYTDISRLCSNFDSFLRSAKY